MMYIEDCLKGVVEFMEKDQEELKRRTYNIWSMSFTPEELAQAMRKYIPDLTVTYKPDFRQEIGEQDVLCVDTNESRIYS